VLGGTFEAKDQFTITINGVELRGYRARVRNGHRGLHHQKPDVEHRRHASRRLRAEHSV
jgi:hypothetical protein